MRKAIVLKHVDYEGPAALEPLLAERGYELDTRELYNGAEVPSGLASGELLVVMGGPMGVGDLENDKFPFLKKELELLQACVAQDAAVLGICLGAQLLAHAAGAAVYPMRDTASGERQFEVGWAPLDFHQHERDPALSGLPARATVLHLHGDTFDLPRGARWLASTPVCKHQAFRLGRQFGLQFHCEMREPDVAAFLKEGASFVRAANGAKGVEELLADTARHATATAAIGERLLKNILGALAEK